MNIELTSLPETIDVFHVALALIAGVLLALLITRSKDQQELTTSNETTSDDSISQNDRESEQTAETIPNLNAADPTSAKQLLALLQQESRFIDFIQEDLSAAQDNEIGAVARVIHEGAQKVFKEYVSLLPVAEQDEESKVTLEKGFDASAWKLTGNVVGDAPFTGVLVHKGWQVQNIELPKLATGHNADILAAAEVEL